MTELADYLDLLEPRTTIAPAAPPPSQTAFRPAQITVAPMSRPAPSAVPTQMTWRQCLGAAPPPGMIYRPPTKYRRSTTRVSTPSSDFRRVLQTPGPASPAADPAADQARADCVAFCAANPASADCRPDAPGQPGSGGFCAAWLPGGTQGGGGGGGGGGTLFPGGGGGGGTLFPGRSFDPGGGGGGGGGGGTPQCPEGSFWNGMECQVPAIQEEREEREERREAQKGSNWGLLLGLAVVAFVARRAMG